MDSRNIGNASAADKETLLDMYQSMIGGPADWNEYYPSLETIESDLANEDLFVMKNEAGEILSAISIDRDEEVDRMECWSKELIPSGEVSRVCVRKDMQGQGIAKIMMEYVFDILRGRGKKGVHILVRDGHTAALKCYTSLGFKKAGECDLFDKHFICMERKL